MSNIKLDNKIIELLKNLFNLKQSLDLYKLISLNAGEINKKAGKTFFVHAQSLALNTFVLDICKIFEEENRYKLNSIPAIINFIQSGKVKPKHPDIIETYITKHKEKVIEKFYYAVPLKLILKKFKDKNKNHLSEFKRFRDSKAAHAEDISITKINSLPSYDTMEKFLFFAIDFYSIIYEAYIDGVPVDIKTDKRVFVSLSAILNKVGLQNIKKDFDD